MLEMESSGPVFVDEERALKCLLDAFGSTFSLYEISSAYCKAGRNADKASEFLSEMQGSAVSSSSTDNLLDGEARGTKLSSVASCTNSDVSEQSCEGNENSGPIVPRNRPVSVGSVSSVIGKGYIRTTRSSNGSCNATKPRKLDAKVLPDSELWGEESESNSARGDLIHRYMEEFLYSMLGDGFQLEMNVIREVLEACGYDMPKSMEKLLDLSTTNMDKKNAFDGDSTDEIGLCSKAKAPWHQKKGTSYFWGNEDAASNSRLEVPTKQKQRNDLEREILTALFDAPEREAEYALPKRKVTAVRRSGTFGKPVTAPPHDPSEVNKTTAVQQQLQNEHDEEEEESFKAVRRAVKEYRVLVKEYYQSAVEACGKGNHARAQKLLEQGKFFNQKAHEKDEESSKMILGNGDVEAHDVKLLDLHYHGAKEAIQLLKSDLSSFSGIPSFKYLKVIIETNEEDKSKGSRRRRVEKLLKKESIKWVEDENAGTILIRLDSFNRKSLSFINN